MNNHHIKAKMLKMMTMVRENAASTTKKTNRHLKNTYHNPQKPAKVDIEIVNTQHN